jgi:hypothetical protein
MGEAIVPEEITIAFETLTVRAELNDSPCAESIRQVLPLQGRVNTWGEEIYFSIGLALETSDAARSDVSVGEVAYWPAGQALCIFFGRTPASGSDGEPRAASDVEPLGRIVGATDALKGVADGEKVVVSADS